MADKFLNLTGLSYLWGKIKDEIHREFILKKLEKEFEIGYNTLEKRLLSLTKNEDKKTVVEAVKVVEPKKLNKDKYYIATYKLLYLLITNKKCLEEYDEGMINFLNEEERFLASEISYYYKKYGRISVADFYTYINDKEELKKVFDRIFELDVDNEITEREKNDYINTLKEFQVKEEIKRLKAKIKDEPDVAKQIEIASRIRELKNNF